MTLEGTAPYTIRPRRRRHLFVRLMRNPAAAISFGVIVLIVLMVVLADVIAPTDPTTTNLRNTLQSPSWEHPLGTDAAGRDIFSRVLHGGQLTLVGALLVVVIAIVVGVGSGLLAGYYGKVVDAVSTWMTALIMSLPVMIVLLAVRSAFGPSVLILMGTLGLLITPAFFLLVRSSVRNVRGELYVDAARVSGLSDARIIGRHILTAIRAPLIIQSMMVASLAIGVQSALDFLGLGATDGPTWGGMLAEGFDQIYKAPQLMFWPAVFIGAMTAALLVLGNALRDTVEDRPRLKAPKVVRPVSKNVPTVGSPATKAVPVSIVKDTAAVADPLLSVEGLTVAYATAHDGVREVVTDISLQIGRGRVLGLVGESGSGKTQIAFSILGLLPESASVTAGRILFDGIDLLGMTPKERQRSRIGGVAYIPQEPLANLDPCFTIGDQLMEPLRAARGMSRALARTTALELLADVSIPDPPAVMRKYPHEISGGMAQRVLIAAALSLEPRLLVADEPTTALDVTVQSGVLALLRRLQLERDLGVLLVTHDLGVAAELCDDVAVLRSGKLQEVGPVDDVFYRPSSQYTRDLLDATLADAEPRAAWSATPERNPA